VLLVQTACIYIIINSSYIFKQPLSNYFCYQMKRAYVVDAARTAVGRFGGALSSVRPDDLGAEVIKALIQRNPSIDLNEIEDVIFGAANQAGEDNRNVARMSLLMAGYLSQYLDLLLTDCVQVACRQ